jgi:hypothetical protein
VTVMAAAAMLGTSSPSPRRRLFDMVARWGCVRRAREAAGVRALSYGEL